MERADVAVVGGGIVGLATAHAVLAARPALKVIVLEKEAEPARHQSGRNSGVIHSGVYYRPGSLKALTVAAGRRALLALCDAHGIPYRISGKVIVATDGEGLRGLHRLLERARGGGVAAELIRPERLAELEPHAVGIAALHVPDAGVVDFRQVCETLVDLVRRNGGLFQSGAHVLSLTDRGDSAVVASQQGDVEAKVVANCAGLQSDQLTNHGAPAGPRDIRIVPFRGEYRHLRDDRSHLVRSMIYPVPDPTFPFLGPHFTRGIDGEVHAGPNAVLALAREGYSWRAFDVADTYDLIRFQGFRRLARSHWRMGLSELYRSLSPRAFTEALRQLVPEVSQADLVPATAGVRAQAVDASGALVDDFVIRESRRVVHVLNAPSPAATASLEIGRVVAERVTERL
ncbi:MAG: L-2-hydroxyglutarate oxidase [Actinomycetota bacterium]|nr:L-2-hydroxyglutarate oxidase [Actinomycetota bacterium]